MFAIHKPRKSEIIEAIEGAWLYPTSRYSSNPNSPHREPVGYGYSRLPESTKAMLRQMTARDIADVRVDRFLP